MVKTLNLDKIRARLERVPKEFNQQVAQIGIPQGPQYEDGTSVAYVAAIQEFGAPAVSIPARSFFRPTIAEKKAEWVGVMKQMVPKVGDGSASAFDVLDTVGRVAVADIQTTIAGVNAPALSPITVLLRKWKKDGRTITGKTVGEAAAAIAAGVDPGDDDKPLNATGLLIASIHNAVNRPGAEFSV